MFDDKLVIEIITQIINSIKTIERRFEKIKSSDDFLDSEYGMDMLDSICMQLIAIGESIKNIDKITHHKLLFNYSNIDWKGIKGIRDIISHHYFDLDAEEIFNICKNEINPLKKTLKLIFINLGTKWKYHLTSHF